MNILAKIYHVLCAIQGISLEIPSVIPCIITTIITAHDT